MVTNESAEPEYCTKKKNIVIIVEKQVKILKPDQSTFLQTTNYFLGKN